MAGCDDFVENRYQEISMGTGEDGNVHGHGGRVRFIQSYAKIAFARQQ